MDKFWRLYKDFFKEDPVDTFFITGALLFTFMGASSFFLLN